MTDEELDAQIAALTVKNTARVNAAAPARYEEGAEPWYEDMAEGAAASLMETGYGIKDLVGMGSPEDAVTLADWQADAAQSGYGAAGGVVGDIAQVVGTGGMVGVGAKSLLKAAAMAKAKRTGMLSTVPAAEAATVGMAGVGGVTGAAVAADVAASGGAGDLKTPEAGESRLNTANKDMAWAAGGNAIVNALGKIGKGAIKTPEGQKLLDEGIPLAPDQAAAGGPARLIANNMKVQPFMAKGMTTGRQKAMDDWTLADMDKAAPDGVYISGNTVKGKAGQLSDAYKEKYGEVWGQARKPSAIEFGVMKNMVDSTMPKVAGDSQGPLNGVNAALEALMEDFAPQAVKSFDNSLKKKIRSAARAGDSEMETGLEAIRLQLQSTLPDAAQKQLDGLNAKYGDFLAVKEASSAAAHVGGMYTPVDLMNASKKVGGLNRNFRQTAPKRAEADEGMATVGRDLDPILPTIRKANYAQMPSPQAAMDKFNQFYLGETASQKMLQGVAKNNNRVAEALRSLGAPAGYAAGEYFEEN